ncbi:MAG TPA: hypothetical protein VIV54_13495, partial [Burkholderiales bacterium]
MAKLHSAAELEALRADIVSRRDAGKRCISVCAGAGCDAANSASVADALRTEGAKAGVEVKVTGCHGFCEKGPNVLVTPGDLCHFSVRPEDAQAIVAGTAQGIPMSEVPFYKYQTRLLIGDNPKIDPTRIEDYLALGGYAALS